MIAAFSISLLLIWAYSKFGLRPMPSTLDALKQVSGGLIRKMSSQEVANTLYGICICICICICRTNDDWVAWLTEAFLFYYVPALSSVRISTVFQHCRRAFLLHCSTLCMHFYHVPVLSAYISIVLQFPCISLGFLDWEYLTFWEAFWTALGCFWGA